MFAGCTVRKLGLAAFEVELPSEGTLMFVTTPWPTHTITVVDKGGRLRHIVSHSPPGRPHVSPACPFEAELYEPA